MEESISHLIKILNNQVSRDINTFALTHDLTGTQVQILDFLNNNSIEGDVFQKDVEKEFNIRRSTATNILKNMEEKELIKRTPLESDSRLKAIVVLERGKSVQGEISTFLEKTDQRILSNLGPLEKRSFVKALRKLPEKMSDKS